MTEKKNSKNLEKEKPEKTRKKTEDSKLFKYFKQQFVQIAAKSLKGKQKLADGSVLMGNLMIEGYLLDQDDLYFYLGETSDAVTEAILKEDVVRMINNIEAEMELLYGGEMPDEEEVH